MVGPNSQSRTITKKDLGKGKHWNIAKTHMIDDRLMESIKESKCLERASKIHKFIYFQRLQRAATTTILHKAIPREEKGGVQLC
ncbi:hypothetical protein AMTR_s00029p00046050 [Amborella trichopoda]|uniref:Uncharacterized protein n=1 Tax=Amborella trichopoda TaxID=13333 RepID=W1PHD1_AMBTC|nr:hypothetical protein AMTR_s00029p00046050 [Amborella trichopoda]